MAASPGSSSGPGSGSGPGAAGAGAVRWFLVRVAAAVAATAIVLFVGAFLLGHQAGGRAAAWAKGLVGVPVRLGRARGERLTPASPEGARAGWACLVLRDP
jgi:hypothetical protein